MFVRRTLELDLGATAAAATAHAPTRRRRESNDFWSAMFKSRVQFKENGL